MSDVITKAQEILVAHDATRRRDLVQSALMTAEGFLNAVGDRLTANELSALGERCFRIEATRLGMKPSEVDNHWRAHLDVQRLSELVSKTEGNSPALFDDFSLELGKILTPPPESRHVKQLVNRFQCLSSQGVTRIIPQRDLKKARAVLGKHKPDGNDFNHCLGRLFHHRVSLRPLKRSVEACYRKLSSADRKIARPAMLEFYSNLRDFNGLETLLPARPRQWVEVPLEMETCLRLNRLSKAKALAAFCESKLDPEKRFCYELPLRNALAQYYSSLGDYDAALKQIVEMDTGNLWAYENYPSLVSIKTMEALQIAMKAQQEMAKTAKDISSRVDTKVLKERRRLKWTITQLKMISKRFDENI